MRIVKKQIVEDKENYWDITIPKNHNFVLDNGCVVHNCGCGVGFSVERQFIANLPVINEDFYQTETIIQVHDSRIGWSTAFRQLIALLYAGQIPHWDLSKLRPKGARLKTFGGRASGPEPLNQLFKFCVEIFKRAAGRRLNSIECHDIVCKIADIVIVGGVRRSALISLSNLSDDRMRNAKTGQWWVGSPQRALANNSSAYTEKPEIEIFLKEWLTLIESKSGERGIFNRVSATKKAASTGRRKTEGIALGTNPCGEIYLRSCGFCNLSEVVIRPEDDLETLTEKVRLASIIGTFQSTLTDFRYIRNIWKKNAEEERLLGVSLTGIMDHPILSQVTKDAEMWLTLLRATAINTNKEWAEKLGIEQSAAVTCVKPSGCQSLDNKIKTSDGDKSVREIFEMVGWTEEMMEGMEREWLDMDLSSLPQVLDENNRLQDITGLFVNGLEPVYEIEFEDGNTYQFTGNHKLKTDKGWKRVDELTEEDEVISYK
jgi:ribonucleoside-diphosphate reductase alpha chain